MSLIVNVQPSKNSMSDLKLRMECTPPPGGDSNEIPRDIGVARLFAPVPGHELPQGDEAAFQLFRVRATREVNGCSIPRTVVSQPVSCNYNKKVDVLWHLRFDEGH